MCDRAYLAPLVTTVYFCGVMLGGVIFGSLSDRSVWTDMQTDRQTDMQHLKEIS